MAQGLCPGSAGIIGRYIIFGCIPAEVAVVRAFKNTLLQVQARGSLRVAEPQGHFVRSLNSSALAVAPATCHGMVSSIEA